jgi:hypothetical protein
MEVAKAWPAVHGPHLALESVDSSAWGATVQVLDNLEVTGLLTYRASQQEI